MILEVCRSRPQNDVKHNKSRFRKAFIWQFQGDRVTVAAGIRLSTWMVQNVDTLKWFLTGIVNLDDDFDSTNRSGRSRAVRWCLDIS